MLARATLISITLIIFLLVIVFKPAEANFVNTSTGDTIQNLRPPSFLMQEYIKQYAKQYNIPIELMYNCAKLETGYKGVLHEQYNPYKKEMISSAQAYGPMQIRICAARQVWTNIKISDSELAKKLRYDVEFNVHTSAKYLNYLRYAFKASWLQAFSMYNQGMVGKTNINQYAKNIVY